MTWIEHADEIGKIDSEEPDPMITSWEHTYHLKTWAGQESSLYVFMSVTDMG